MRPELPPLAVAPRASGVRERLAAAGAEALLVTALPNVRWLTGFTGSAARVLVLPDEVVLVTDGRYGEQATDELGRAGVAGRVLVAPNRAEQASHLRAVVAGIARLGLEAAHVSWADVREYDDLFAPATLVPTTGMVEAGRATKDDAEIARITGAAAIADAALAGVLPLLDAAPTEAEVALALDSEMRRLGADGPAFDTIVASGPNAARPHHRPGDRRLVAGDLVVIDFGARLEGYRSDMTRTVVLGDPAPALAEALAVATLAQAAGVAVVAPGVAAADVDRACREVVRAAGLGDCFTHGTGHGLGLEIHEPPWLNATSEDRLAAGAVLTVEPGVYRVGLGGARVEDTVLVTADGCRPLTTTPKDLSCLPSPPTT